MLSKTGVTRRELRKSPLTTLIITRIYVGERYLRLKQLSVSERDICLCKISSPKKDIQVFLSAHVDFPVRNQRIYLREIDICIAANVTNIYIYIYICMR